MKIGGVVGDTDSWCRVPVSFPFLSPAYSPNLNAVEYIWRKTKRAITHNRFFRKLQDLKEAPARRFNGF